MVFLHFPLVAAAFLEALPAAVLGAVLVLGALGLLHLWRRSRNGPGPEAARAEIARLESGLREFALEVETRLDARIDRLEALLAQSRNGAGPGTAGVAAPEPPRGAVAEPGSGRREDLLSAVSQADRERVLALAALGKRTDAIADSVGLLRGEVDLILRLHRSAERVHDG
jgi:hypothetical protein